MRNRVVSKRQVKPNRRWQYESPWVDKRMEGEAGKLVELLAVSLLYMYRRSKEAPFTKEIQYER